MSPLHFQKLIQPAEASDHLIHAVPSSPADRSGSPMLEDLRTALFPTSLAPSFPDLPETEEGKNGRRGPCGPREMAADRWDKGPRTPNTPPHTHTQKMATSGRGAVSVSLPSRTPHSHGSHSAQGGDSCSPQQMFSREAGELTPKPDPHDSPRRPKRPAEPAV